MPRTIAIGDIHGCDVALETLLRELQPTKEDTVITLGDVVDRGPDTRRTIDLLLELRGKCNLVTIKGNHEEMMLNVIVDRKPPHTWLQFGGLQTLDSYGFVGDLDVLPKSHVEFLSNFSSFYETQTHFFLHANYDPKKALCDQTGNMLRWKRLDDYLPGPHMSGKMAILGHTAERSGEVFSIGHLVCIDTYCHGGKWLTALDADSGLLYQANQRGELRDDP